MEQFSNLLNKYTYAWTYIFKFSFFLRVARLWNSLPLSLRKIKSISSFKKELTAYCFVLLWYRSSSLNWYYILYYYIIYT